jgi:hypothetical protein
MKPHRDGVVDIKTNFGTWVENVWTEFMQHRIGNSG